MKIALFSDIHANLPALEAFFADVESRQVDALYCLGDLVEYNVWPNQVVDQIRKRGIPTMAGNYDFGIGRVSDDCGCAYKTDQEKDNGQVSIAYTNEIIQDEQRAYLRTLPAHIRLEYQLNDQPLQVLLVHGSPRRINEYLFEDREEKSLLRIMEQASADVMLFGHTHKPYHRIIQSEAADGKRRMPDDKAVGDRIIEGSIHEQLNKLLGLRCSGLYLYNILQNDSTVCMHSFGLV